MQDSIEIQPCGALDADVRPPGSKSITNRALCCAALAIGPSRLSGVLDADDTRIMASALETLGFTIDAQWETSDVHVQGGGGAVPAREASLMLGNSGTSIRFLTALCCLGQGSYLLDGIPRMRERPIGALVDSLNELGGDVSCMDGRPPVKVSASGLRGGAVRVDGSESSQFLSAILMTLPWMREYSVARTTGSAVSRPYIRMTCAVMRRFGVDVLQLEEAGEYSVDPRHRYVGTDFDIEPDATAASYFWGAAAIAGGRVRVNGLGPNSIQGDARFAQILEEAGCAITSGENFIEVTGPATRGIEVDMGDVSDTVQTLASVALFVDGVTVIRGVAHNRHKESDRIGNLATELRKLGARVDERDDGLAITPGPLRPARIDTWNDHRMAMALSLVGLRQPGVVINDPHCVTKTWPGYFDALRILTSSADPSARSTDGNGR